MQWLFGRGGMMLFTNLRSSSITRLNPYPAAGLLKLKPKTSRYIEFNNINKRFGGCCCYATTSTTTGGGNTGKSKSRKSSLKKVVIDEAPAEEDNKKKKKTKRRFLYVVRKGDMIGLYNELPHQLPSSSVCDVPVSVYKGYNMSKEAETYFLSRGFKDALYSIRAVDFRQDLFADLVSCPFQDPHVSIGEPLRMFQQLLGSETGRACILEFDGACKGNPGISGAGAVLRTPDGTLLCRLREGLGTATNNVAEYRAMILGLRYALSKGFTSIYVVGDSKLVCMQIQGLWRARHPNMIKWYEEAKKLKDEFLLFHVNHVLRDKNSAADAQANLAVVLADGEVQEEDVDRMKTDSHSQESMAL